MNNVLAVLILTFLSSSAAAKGLAVHEWGTFTSFMGADGKRQPGMHEEEEPLPNFVYGVKNSQERGTNFFDFDDRCDRPKVPCHMLNGFSPLPIGESLPVNPVQNGVTQKMETPVIYFYGDVGETVNVKIDFPKGIISQYYPRASSYTPKFTNITTLGPSQFTFDVELLSKDANTRIPRTQPHSIWNPAREVNANTIRVENEEEKFIFYRGVADFSAKFSVLSNKDDKIQLINESTEGVPAAFLLLSDGETGVIKSLGRVEAISSLRSEIPTLENGLEFNQYVQEAKRQISRALINSGLFADEALAMVNTWEKSYFHTPGLRVLYVVPNNVTEEILPLTITPKPVSMVRTLIGRVEIMTENEERAYLDQLLSTKDFDAGAMFGRFKEPKVTRLIEKVNTMKLAAKDRALILSRLQPLL